MKSRLTTIERLHRKGQGQLRRGKNAQIENLIVMGASAGGYKALPQIVRELSPDIPAAIVLTLHLPTEATRTMEGVSRYSRLPFITVQESEPLRHGAIFIPQPGKSVIVHRGKITTASNGQPAYPLITINRLFASAAKSYRNRVIGVILTGMMKDGTAGLRAVHDAGGITIVQDPEDAEFSSMPGSAMEGLPVTFCLGLSEIGLALELLVRRTTKLETGMAVAIRILRQRIAFLLRLAEQSQGNLGTCDFLIEELASLRSDIRSIDALLTHLPENHNP